MFNIDDIITTKSWQSLCDYIYNEPDHPNIPDGGVVWCAMDQIPEFFRRINGNSRAYIVVSSHSDFGLGYQEEYPVCNDMITTLQRLIYTHGYKKIGYNGINITPPCYANKCNINDKYTTKAYSLTNATFQCVPNEVKHWFLVNNMIEDDTRLTTIPFGIQEGNEKLYSNIEPADDKKLLYVNFASHTMERVRLKEYFSKQDWCTFKQDVPREEFIDDLCSHYFTLCPNGNGIDSFRTLEALYCGSIPVTSNNVTFRSLDLSVLCDNFYKLQDPYLRRVLFMRSSETFKNNIRNMCKLSFWREKVLTAKKNLL